MDILVVEDDYISRNMLKKLISEMGHDVVEAENGQMAWDLLQRRIIQVIVTDWMMPGMDGLELCRQIREAPFDRYVYLIVLTAKDRKADLVEVFQCGADDYIPKPFDPEELRARVLTGLRVIDLEERHRRMQRTLVESRNKLRIVNDALKEEIVALDRDFVIHMANRAFCEKMGVKPEDIIGKHCNDNKGCQLAHAESLVDNVFDKGIAQTMMHTDQDADGSTKFKQIAFLPVKNEAHEVEQVVIVSNDVTEVYRKKEEIDALNRRLLESTQQLEAKNSRVESALNQLQATQSQMMQSEKMASIGQLAAGVAHEINTPTGYVANNLKTLEKYQVEFGRMIEKYRELVTLLKSTGNEQNISDDCQAKIAEIETLQNDMEIDFLLEDVLDLIGDCRQGAERIKTIVTDLKAFAHPGEEIMKPTDINQGLATTLNVVYHELKYKADLQTDYGSIPYVMAVSQQLNQVFMNILINAAQAIEKNGQISVKTTENNGIVEILISDTGCGISDKDLDRIFDPFHTTKPVGMGTGLGMHIARDIIQKHNGDIHVQSQVGKGTTFTIRLPAMAAQETE